MTHESRLAALERRGYTRRQAAFLALVLIHSGCFLRRQYTAFLGVADGSPTTSFVHHLVTRHLATRQAYIGRTLVYRVASPALYDAVGEPNSRHRRPVEPAAVTQRLMTLDVLIAHRDTPCLGTAGEKDEYFTRVLGVPPEDLPGRASVAPRAGTGPVRRSFAERVPVLLPADGTTFVYVPGWAPLGAFASFLNAYTPLLRRVPCCRVLFCTADTAVLERAERMCLRRFGASPDADPALFRRDVIAHFEARRRFEAREFRSFTDEERVRLRSDLQRFSGPRFEQWYDRWRLHGNGVAPPDGPPTGGTPGCADVRFVPFVLPDRYPFVGRAQAAA
jgi:hypothetical protein